MAETTGERPLSDEQHGLTRRRMVGLMIAAPTVMTAATWVGPERAQAAAGVPTVQPVDFYDLSDLLTQSTMPTWGLITVTVGKDGTASHELPRAEVGQGVVTSTAMIIADELDLPLEKVKVTLAPARPELLYNQFTGASNTIHAIYQPLRLACALAKFRLMEAAAQKFGEDVTGLSAANGVITSLTGRSATYGELAELAAAVETTVTDVKLKPKSRQNVIGTEQVRTDARAAVTGAKPYAMDLDVPNALPTMVCRPPTLNGSAQALLNRDEIARMPGVTHVAVLKRTQYVAGGVAVRAKTFGQCIDAIRAMKVSWSKGTAEGKSDEDVMRDLKRAELPLTPALPGKVMDQTFTFFFRPGDPLEPNCAVADVRKDGTAEIWAATKSPIWGQEQVAAMIGTTFDKVKLHVVDGGGSFGRHLFCDNVFEAAAASQAMGVPVKLMWHRADGPRQGRTHAARISRVRLVHDGKQVLSLDQRHTGVQSDFTHGIGEIFTSVVESQPGVNFATFSQGVFLLTANVPYNFGPVTQLLNEIYEFNRFNTSSVRNVYSPDVRTAIELMVDQAAAAMGKDPLAFRLEFLRDERLRAALQKAAEIAQWGRPLPAGVAQGIGVHSEYKSRAACILEVDARPETVNRRITNARTGPRVTRATFVADVGRAINPLGVKAQVMGGMLDGIANALTYSLHLEDGRFLEASWDNTAYTRQWNVPFRTDLFVMPDVNDDPGGCGELGVAAAMAAAACAYGRAVGKMPTAFPIAHDEPLHFEPFPFVPAVPESPVDGLEFGLGDPKPDTDPRGFATARRSKAKKAKKTKAKRRTTSQKTAKA